MTLVFLCVLCLSVCLHTHCTSPQSLVSIFNDHELELLISGLPEIDVDDLRANTEYSGFTAGSPVVQWFWEVVREMDAEQLALLVQFVTGTPLRTCVSCHCRDAGHVLML